MVINLNKKILKEMAKTKHLLSDMEFNIEKIKKNPYSLLMGIKLSKIKVHLGWVTNASHNKDTRTAKKWLNQKIKTKADDKYAVTFGYPSEKQLVHFKDEGIELLACIVYKQDQANYIPVDLTGIEIHELDDSFITLAVAMFCKYGRFSNKVREVMREAARHIFLDDANVCWESNFNLFDYLTKVSNIEEIEPMYMDWNTFHNHHILHHWDFKSSYPEYGESHIKPLSFLKDSKGNNVNIFMIDEPIHDFHRFQAKGSGFHDWGFSGHCEQLTQIDILVAQMQDGHIKMYALGKYGYRFILEHFKDISLQNGLSFDVYKQYDSIYELIEFIKDSPCKFNSYDDPETAKYIVNMNMLNYSMNYYD